MVLPTEPKRNPFYYKGFSLSVRRRRHLKRERKIREASSSGKCKCDAASTLELAFTSNKSKIKRRNVQKDRIVGAYRKQYGRDCAVLQIIIKNDTCMRKKNLIQKEIRGKMRKSN